MSRDDFEPKRGGGAGTYYHTTIIDGIITPDNVAVSARSGMYSGSVELGRRLLLAARNGDTQQVLDLMAKGAPFTTDWLGTSTLHLAAGGAHAGTCAVLLRAGVSRDARTKVERTPLHVAAHRGHAAVCELLLNHGSRVDCRDMLRMTPLHWAVARGHAAAAAVLVRHGADPDARSKFGKTPRSLAAAARPSRPDLVALLDRAPTPIPATPRLGAEVDDQMKEITEAEQQRALESIERLQETVKPSQKETMYTEPIKIEYESRNPEVGGGTDGGGGAALLQAHGISLLERDESSTVLNALQSGRTVVLSDAGKLMLKESSAPSPKVSPHIAPATSRPAPAPRPAPALAHAPFKIYTLNNGSLTLKEDKPPTKKILNPHDMQIKFVSIPADAKLISSNKASMKAKSRLRPSVVSPQRPGAGRALSVASRGATAGPAGRPAVKIIVNKANFSKLFAGQSAGANGIELKTKPMTPELCTAVEADVGEEGVEAALEAAQREAAALRGEVAALKRRLAAYEPV